MSGRFNPATTLFPLMLVSLLAGLSYWLDLASHPEASRGDGKLRHDPDFIVERFAIRRFDPQGALQHTLHADHMRHYPDDDSTAIQSPRLTYHRQPPTFVSAHEALIGGKGEQVQLSGDVQVTRAAWNGKPDTVLTTERLDAFPDEESARTDAPVTIVQGRSKIAGTGLTTNAITGIHSLGGPVRGIFHRNASTATMPPLTRAAAIEATQPVAKPKPPKLQSKPQSKPKVRPKPKTKSKAKPT